MHEYFYPENYENEDLNPIYPYPPCMRNSSGYECPFKSMHRNSHPRIWSFGPFKIEYILRPNNISLIFRFKDQIVNDCVLTTTKPDFNFNLNIFGAASIKLQIFGDFSEKSLGITGEICIANICDSFNNTIIAKW